MHVLEKVMIVKSSDPIFDYEIGFDSDEGEKEIGLRAKEEEDKSIFYEDDFSGSEDFFEIQNNKLGEWKGKKTYLRNNYMVPSRIHFSCNWNPISEADKLKFL